MIETVVELVGAFPAPIRTGLVVAVMAGGAVVTMVVIEIVVSLVERLVEQLVGEIEAERADEAEPIRRRRDERAEGDRETGPSRRRRA